MTSVASAAFQSLKNRRGSFSNAAMTAVREDETNNVGTEEEHCCTATVAGTISDTSSDSRGDESRHEDDHDDTTTTNNKNNNETVDYEYGGETGGSGEEPSQAVSIASPPLVSADPSSSRGGRNPLRKSRSDEAVLTGSSCGTGAAAVTKSGSKKRIVKKVSARDLVASTNLSEEEKKALLLKLAKQQQLKQQRLCASKDHQLIESDDGDEHTCPKTPTTHKTPSNSSLHSASAHVTSTSSKLLGGASSILRRKKKLNKDNACPQSPNKNRRPSLDSSMSNLMHEQEHEEWLQELAQLKAAQELQQQQETPDDMAAYISPRRSPRRRSLDSSMSDIKFAMEVAEAGQDTDTLSIGSKKSDRSAKSEPRPGRRMSGIGGMSRDRERSDSFGNGGGGGGIIGGLGCGMSALGNGLVTGAQGLGNGIVKTGQGLGNGIVKTGQGLGNGIVKTGQGLGNGIVKTGQGLGNGIVKTGQGLGNGIVKTGSVVVNTSAKVGTGLVSASLTGAQGISNGIVKTGQGLGSAVVKTGQGLGTGVAMVGTGIMTAGGMRRKSMGVQVPCDPPTSDNAQALQPRSLEHRETEGEQATRRRKSMGQGGLLNNSLHRILATPKKKESNKLKINANKYFEMAKEDNGLDGSLNFEDLIIGSASNHGTAGEQMGGGSNKSISNTFGSKKEKQQPQMPVRQVSPRRRSLDSSMQNLQDTYYIGGQQTSPSVGATHSISPVNNKRRGSLDSSVGNLHYKGEAVATPSARKGGRRPSMASGLAQLNNGLHKIMAPCGFGSIQKEQQEIQQQQDSETEKQDESDKSVPLNTEALTAANLGGTGGVADGDSINYCNASETASVVSSSSTSKLEQQQQQQKNAGAGGVGGLKKVHQLMMRMIGTSSTWNEMKLADAMKLLDQQIQEQQTKRSESERLLEHSKKFLQARLAAKSEMGIIVSFKKVLKHQTELDIVSQRVSELKALKNELVTKCSTCSSSCSSFLSNKSDEVADNNNSNALGCSPQDFKDRLQAIFDDDNNTTEQAAMENIVQDTSTDEEAKVKIWEEARLICGAAAATATESKPAPFEHTHIEL